MSILCVPSIAMLVYFLLTLYKETIAMGREKYIRIIPLMAGLLGLVFGLVAFYTTPEIINASNIIDAMIIGLTSGLAATGTNQIFKQFNGKLNKKNDVDQKEE